MNRRLPLALLLALTLAATRVLAVYLPEGTPDATTLLATPPVLGSEEDKLDLANTLAVYQSATPVESELARDENNLTIFHFNPVLGPWFAPGKFPKTEALFKAVEADAKHVTDTSKKFFKRPRPYHVVPERFPHSIEHEDPTHYSYPSGHSTRATVYALLLAELFPAQRDALLAKGREAGWLRVKGGVHYPTDIYAGRVLGQELARDFLAAPKFREDFAAARAELAAAGK